MLKIMISSVYGGMVHNIWTFVLFVPYFILVFLIFILVVLGIARYTDIGYAAIIILESWKDSIAEFRNNKGTTAYRNQQYRVNGVLE